MSTEHGFDIPTTPDAWCARVQREHPDLSVEILGIFPGADGELVETVRISGAGAARAIETMRFTDSVDHFEVLAQEPDACTVRLKTRSCEACLAAQITRIAPTFPLVLGRGMCHWRLQSEPENVRSFAAHLKTTRQAPKLTRKRQLPSSSLLTARQREILSAAVAHGYYARPRRSSLTELAEVIGIRKSSLSQTLATIEAKLLPRWAEE